MSELNLKTIEFNWDYLKLHGQTRGLLVAVIQNINGGFIQNTFPDLIDFDSTDKDFLIHPFIESNQEYMLLLFIGENKILFPTFRKQNEENVNKYADSIGQLFKINISGQ